MQMKTAGIKAAIVGASGYGGAELMRLLSAHSHVVLSAVLAGSSAGKRVDEVYPEFSGRIGLTFEPLEADGLDRADVAFVSLPSGESMRVVPEILDRVPKVIDLSGDFRLKEPEQYEQFYQHKHVAPHLLGKSVYGLPELNKSRISASPLTANPGCYPTGAILALLPALQHDIIEPKSIVITSMSGTSGAGRASSLEMSFTEVHDNMRAYKVGTHQHIPEIQSVLSEAAGTEVVVSFIPHLVPMNRGIYTTIHAGLKASISDEDLFGVYEDAYASEPFVRVRRQVPQLKDVLRTNYCDIGLTIDRRSHHLILLSVIDNLVKGAAGQAIQNMNLMCGLPEETGLCS